MPTYEYACDNCQAHFEIEQRISDPVGAICPSCHTATTRRLISATHFSLKGGGWYKDGYNPTSSASTTSSSSSAPTPPETKSGKKDNG